MRTLRGAVAVAIAPFVLFSSAVVFAAAPAPAFGVGVTPARLEWKLPAGIDEVHNDVVVFNRSSGPVDVQLELRDVAIDRNGAWQLLPAHSTPYSFPATFVPDHFSLARGASVKVRVSATIERSRPLFGGVLVHPTAITSTGTAPGEIGVQVNPDLLIPLVAAPVGSDGTVEGVELSGQGVGLHVPMIFEHGPIAITAAARNTSQFYERSFTTVVYSAWGHTYLTQDLPPVGTFPGTVATSTAASIVQAPGAGAIDPSPWIGLVHITTTTHMTLIDSSAPPIVQDRWVLVLPYRALLIGLAVLVALVLARRWRSRRWQ
jgi:hypothetical protein